jgi:hypothetical protein
MRLLVPSVLKAAPLSLVTFVLWWWLQADLVILFALSLVVSVAVTWLTLTGVDHGVPVAWRELSNNAPTWRVGVALVVLNQFMQYGLQVVILIVMGANV